MSWKEAEEEEEDLSNDFWKKNLEKKSKQIKTNKKPAYEKKTSLKCKQNPPYSCYSQKQFPKSKQTANIS